MDAISGFFTKLFSADSIVSRLVRTLSIIASFIAYAGFPATAPEWLALITAAFAGLVPAGQNQSSPTTVVAKKAVPPSA